jgi:hypothetical protein
MSNIYEQFNILKQFLITMGASRAGDGGYNDKPASASFGFEKKETKFRK